MSCEKNGIIPVRLPAVDGSDPDLRIPEDIVTSYWDSTLNATFDHSCVVNKMTVMSLSERACAWSHVQAWRAVDAVFNSGSMLSGNKKRSFGDTNIEGKDAEDDATSNQHRDTSTVLKELFLFTYLGGGWRSRRCDHDYPISSSTTEFKSIKQSELSTSIRSPLKHDLTTSRREDDKMMKYCLIMEDDAKFVEDEESVAVPMPMRCHISDVIRRLPDCDICYLGYALPKKCTEFEVGFFKPNYLWQLHGYLLSATGARKLLSALPVDAPVDNFIATLIYDGRLNVRNSL